MRIAALSLVAVLALGAAGCRASWLAADGAPPTAAGPAHGEPAFTPIAPPSDFEPIDAAPDRAPAASDGAGAGADRERSPADLVGQLRVAPEGDGAGYDRRLFEHWTDDDGDGCDTRCELLAQHRRTDLPGLPQGGWLSLYDGYSTDDPGELEIDHVVALAEAWRSGAAHWDPERRRAFANDTTGDALLVVTAATNRSKRDRDPAAWQPPSRDAWCAFGAAWTRTKLRWDLTADDAEVRALTNILAGC